MNLATNDIKTLARRSLVVGITLDYTNKRVYWIERQQEIFSSDYDFQDPKGVRNGSFIWFMLSISGDSLYFQTKGGEYPIIQVNMTTGNTVRSIPVNKGYNDLIVFHSSLQSMGMYNKNYKNIATSIDCHLHKENFLHTNLGGLISVKLHNNIKNN